MWTAKQARLLLGYLGQAGHPVLVRHAMRYGKPSIADEMDALRAEGATRVLVLPLYPQYSAATSASVFDAVAAWGQRSRWVPELRFVQQYHDDPGYIDALAAQVRAHWQREGRGRMLVMSFHGVPQRTLQLGDPYHCSCLKTRPAVGRAPGPGEGRIPRHLPKPLRQGASGCSPIPSPRCSSWRATASNASTSSALASWPTAWKRWKRSTRKRARPSSAAGGKTLHYIACLNDRHEWIEALRDIALRHLQGWDTRSRPEDAELQAQRERALRLGAALEVHNDPPVTRRQ